MALSRIVPSGGTTGQVLQKTSGSAHDVEWATPGAGSGITQLTGDATAGPGTGSQAVVVVAIQGQPVSSAAPGTGDLLAWDGAQWEATAGAGGGITELSGDVTAGPGSGLQVATVTQIQGRAVQNVGPNDADVLTWNNGASRWEPAAAAGGLNNYAVRKRAMVLCRGGR